MWNTTGRPEELQEIILAQMSASVCGRAFAKYSKTVWRERINSPFKGITFISIATKQRHWLLSKIMDLIIVPPLISVFIHHSTVIQGQFRASLSTLGSSVFWQYQPEILPINSFGGRQTLLRFDFLRHFHSTSTLPSFPCPADITQRIGNANDKQGEQELQFWLPVTAESFSFFHFSSSSFSMRSSSTTFTL